MKLENISDFINEINHESKIFLFRDTRPSSLHL